MTTTWTLVFSVFFFLFLSGIFFKIMKDYVQEVFGKNWLKSWVNRAYFAQSLIYMSSGGTLLIIYLLKLTDVFSFA